MTALFGRHVNAAPCKSQKFKPTLSQNDETFRRENLYSFLLL